MIQMKDCQKTQTRKIAIVTLFQLVDTFVVSKLCQQLLSISLTFEKLPIVKKSVVMDFHLTRVRFCKLLSAFLGRKVLRKFYSSLSISIATETSLSKLSIQCRVSSNLSNRQKVLKHCVSERLVPAVINSFTLFSSLLLRATLSVSALTKLVSYPIWLFMAINRLSILSFSCVFSFNWNYSVSMSLVNLFKVVSRKLSESWSCYSLFL